MGIEAAQIAAATRWARKRQSEGATTLAAIGPRSSVIACVANALEDGADRLDLAHPYASLRQLIDDDRGVHEAPELFCFGLLEEFDMASLLLLTTPRHVTIRACKGPSDYFTNLPTQFGALGRSFETAD